MTLVESAWNEAQRVNTAKSYEIFLKKFAKSEYAPEAKQKLEQILEEIEWNYALKKHKLSVYESFCKKFPAGVYIEEAEIAKMLLIEDLEWEKAKKKNKVADYKLYIQNYPYSKYIAEANAQILLIAETELWKNARLKNKIPFITNYLSRYPNGAYVREANAMLEKLRKSHQKQSDPALLEKKRTEYLQKIERIKQERNDNEAWKKANETNTFESYVSYLERFSEGKYKKDAQKKIKALGKNQFAS